MKRFHQLTILALLVGSTSPALAERLAVLDLRFESTTPALQQQVRRRLHKALIAAGFDPVANGAKSPVGTLSARCQSGPCLSEIGRRANAPLALVGGVVGQGSSYDITLTLLETSAGTVVAQVNDRCNICTFDEAAATTARAVPSLSVQAEQVIASQAWLVIHTTPPAAEVQIDQVPLGSTPLRRLVSPGPHEVLIKDTKGPAHTRTVELKPGSTKTISVDLGSKPTQRGLHPAAKPRTTDANTIQWVAFGSSLALTTAGTVLLALHEDCSDPPGCTQGRDTRAVGLGLASAGLVATLLSGYWLWSSARTPMPNKAVSALPHRSGLTFVYLGTF